MRADISGVSPLDYNLATRFCVGDLLTRSCDLFADRVAIVDSSAGAITYAQLNQAAGAIGGSLVDFGVEHQEPVAMLMANSWKFVATFFGCASAGLVAMPINLMLNPQDIAWILRDSGATIVVADQQFIPLLETILPQTPSIERAVGVGGELPTSVAGRPVQSWDKLLDHPRMSPVIIEDRDVVHCLYTSGTTSRPKGVLTSHVAVHVAALSNAIQIHHARGDDRTIMPIVLPLFHTTGLDTLLLPVLATGGTTILPSRFEPESFLDLIEEHRPTHVMLLPMMYAAILASPTLAKRDLTSVQYALYAMAPMPEERIGEISAAFPNARVLLGSGQTECVPATVFQWPSHQAHKFNSWGPSVITVETQVMDPSGVLLPPGQVGEIVYRGPHVMNGYWNNTKANTEAFAFGWFHSGDAGYLDDEGVVWFTDRLKDIVKTGGENVSSVEVERAILSVPGVADCAVVGVPDDTWGEIVAAMVVPQPGETGSNTLADRIIDTCRVRLARFAVPKQIHFVDSLPKTATGKTQKAEVRRAIRTSAGAP